MNKYDVITIGDINPDLVFAGIEKLPGAGEEKQVDNMFLKLGGGAALCAAGLAKLGMNISFNSVVGNDLYGKFLISEMNKLNIDTSHINVLKENSTGITVALTNSKNRTFITYKGSNGKLDFNKINGNYLKQAKHVHLTGYCKETHDSFIKIVKMAKENNLTASLDVGWDDTGEWDSRIFNIISLVDIFLPNETEALHYCRCSKVEDALDKLTYYGNLVVIKLGSSGSIAKVNNKLYRKQAYKVDTVDTTGAGDSFNAGFIYSYLNNYGIEQCLSIANACGALSTTGFGGNTSFPNIEKVMDFIKKNSDKYTSISRN
ncbi:carbohydrate kinase family protein [Clostridium pasteurianum]|uniref:Sugar kinase, ribokinase n=1 Tax=Clostridium pasteurianum BC1 TaxID=86416 RepID=R4KFU7_CLOPA|nr:carbohydrate kinase family protein [Clostridium pasteurianum]AGK98480.1 sugar kinase, ribokinase [Clostridium pasteurianum BC1]